MISTRQIQASLLSIHDMVTIIILFIIGNDWDLKKTILINENY